MLKNHLTYTDILLCKKELSNTELITTAKITEILDKAFIKFSRKLRQEKGVIPNQVMMPLNIISNSAIASTTAANYTGTMVTRPAFDILGRIVIAKTACTLTGSNTLVLQGSYNDDDDATYETVKEITLTSGVNTQTATFTDNYAYYKIKIVTADVITPGTPPTTAAGTCSLTGSIYLVENPFDDAVLLLALSDIYSYLSFYVDDSFKAEAKEKIEQFEIEFQKLAFSKDVTGDRVSDYEDGEFTFYERML